MPGARGDAAGVPRVAPLTGRPAGQTYNAQHMRPFLLTLALLLAAAALADTDGAAVREAAERARAQSTIPSPDQPLWRTAIRLAEQYRQDHPDSVEAARLLAETYSEVAWYSRAFDAWLDWSALSGRPPEAEPFTEAALQLGFARLSAGDPQGADRFYSELLAVDPANEEALYRAGSARLQAGDDEGAREAFRELLGLPGERELPPGQLQLAENVTTHGPDAARAFAEGLDAEERGDPGAALTAFEAAWEAARGFREAAVWAGRTALETGEFRRAARWWRIAADLDPGDEGSRWFLERAERLSRFGLDAVAAFDEGTELYGVGKTAEAFTAFRTAARLAPGFKEALSWTARTAQENGNPEAAADWWRQVLNLDPADDSAAYFLRQAEQQLEYGADAGADFLEALQAFQQGDFSGAERGFEAVLGANPEHAAAWGYLGRIRFAAGRYPEAAEAYREAARLEPDNDEYAFFAVEAARLADPQD